MYYITAVGAAGSTEYTLKHYTNIDNYYVKKSIEYTVGTLTSTYVTGKVDTCMQDLSMQIMP